MADLLPDLYGHDPYPQCRSIQEIDFSGGSGLSRFFSSGTDRRINSSNVAIKEITTCSQLMDIMASNFWCKLVNLLDKVSIVNDLTDCLQRQVDNTLDITKTTKGMFTTGCTPVIQMF